MYQYNSGISYYINIITVPLTISSFFYYLPQEVQSMSLKINGILMEHIAYTPQIILIKNAIANLLKVHNFLDLRPYKLSMLLQIIDVAKKVGKCQAAVLVSPLRAGL